MTAAARMHVSGSIDTPPRRNTALIVWFALSVLLRLILSADRDILATNSPYDEYWYIDSALRWIYHGDYHLMAFAQLPLYAMWLKFLSLIGVPVRLAIDLAWIAGCAYLGMAIARFCKRIWPGAVVYLFLCFHPYSIVEFDRTLSETLLTALMVLTLAGFIEIWNLRDDKARNSWRCRGVIIVASLTFACAYHMRKEGVVMLPPLMILLACSLLNRQVWWAQARHTLAYPFIIYPLLATLVLGTALAGANYARWGVFARYELAAPGYVRAISDLNAIDPGATTPRYVTITASTRAKAYAVSPTFSELKSFFEGEPGQSIAKYTEQFSGVSGEIANGWFYWALRDAAGGAGWHVSAVHAEQKYNRMADELEKAFADGRLPKRTVPLSFLDPDWRKWLPYVPNAVLMANRIAFGLDANALGPTLGVPQNASPIQFNGYVAIAGRRRMLEHPHIMGWLIAPEGSSISFGNDERSFSWQPVQGALRSDVPPARSFKLEEDQYETPTQLQIRSPDGKVARIAVADLRAGFVTSTNDIPAVKIGVDEISYLPYVPKANRLLPVWSRMWAVFGWVMLVAGAAAMLCWVWQRRSNSTMFIAICALATILARTCMLALLDSSSWSGLQVRYIFPIVPCVAVFGTFGLLMLSDQIKRRR